jgi:hypothetical protein
VSLVCCFRVEREKARPETSARQGVVRVVRGSVPSGGNRKGLSTVAVGAPADWLVVVVKPL